MKEKDVGEELDRIHTEATGLFREICDRLDSLTHLSYVPHKLRNLGEQDKSRPAVEMDEFLPTTESSNKSVVPEMVHRKRYSDRQLASKHEMSREDRKRQRAQNKRKFQAREKQKRSQVGEGRGVHQFDIRKGKEVDILLKQLKSDKVEKAEQEKGGTKYTKSAAFFKKLQKNASLDGAGEEKGGEKKKGRKSKKYFV